MGLKESVNRVLAAEVASDAATAKGSAAPAIPGHGTPQEPERLKAARNWVKSVEPEGADVEARLNMVARQVRNNHGLAPHACFDIMTEFYVPRMHSPPPDFVLREACGLNDSPAGNGRPHSGGKAKPPGHEERPSGDRFEFVSNDAFATGDYHPDWLVKGVVVTGQPGVIAGPSKTLKTSIGVDLAVSLGTGTPFLGEFRVPRAVKVAMVSGESGKSALQQTMKRVCRAKGIDPTEPGGLLGANLTWCFELPCLSDVVAMSEFTARLKQFERMVVILDPLYLMLGDVDARSLFEVGGVLRALGEMLQKVGATPLLIHHANGRLQTGQVMTLSHLSYAGLEQFVRQWILINRQSEFRGDGAHDLVMSVGGSEGQSKLVAVRVEEGEMSDTFSGRTWDVTVQALTEAKQVRQDEREEKKASRELATEKRHDALVLDAIDAVTARGQEAATEREIRDHSRLNTGGAKAAIKRLQEDGFVTLVTLVKKTAKNQEWTGKGYRRTTVTTQPTLPGCDGGTIGTVPA